MSKQFFQEIIQFIKEKNPDKKKISSKKINLCGKYKLKRIPTDIEILLNTSATDLPKIKKNLKTKPTRTLSGVAVIAIMTSPKKCPHGKCAMCPGGPDSVFGEIPQSYTGKEPATMRAIRNKYDPYLQVFNRLEQYLVLGHMPEKVELIVMGGTFPSFSKTYQENFIKFAIKAMNDFSKEFFTTSGELKLKKFKDFFELPGDIYDKDRIKRLHKKILELKKQSTQILASVQKNNETSKIRCVGLTLETRPDYAKEKHADYMLELGCTRVELGVQSVYDKALKRIERGHNVKDTIDATRILKDRGFKINYHLMPGLPGVSKKDDLEGLKEIFKNQNFRPDMLKIYPCMVLPGTKLFKQWKKKKFKPLSTKESAELIAEFKPFIPEYCRVMRVQRDIPTKQTSAGVDRTNLRQYVQKVLKEKNLVCKCIRCREVGNQKKIKKENIEQIIHVYDSSEGTEFFISIEDTNNNHLYGFCRMRFPTKSSRKEIAKDSVIIRELHVYGEAAEIKKIKKSSNLKTQHQGYGKKLLNLAETLANQNDKNKIVIISGIGVRDYYRKLGYKKQGPYMVKGIK